MDANKRSAMLRREFEALLRSAGASKTERVGAANALSPETIRILLPRWSRIKVRLGVAR